MEQVHQGTPGTRPADLAQPAAGAITSAESVAGMAEFEGFKWTPTLYAIGLAEKLRTTTIALDVQRERLSALCSVGARADSAAADELSRHYLMLEALAQRFALEAVDALQRGGPKAGEAAERFVNCSIKAQRAGVACLSAMKTLRDAPSQAPDNVGDRVGDRAVGGAV